MNKINGQLKISDDLLRSLSRFAPILGLVVLVLLFAVVSGGKSISANNLGIIGNQVIVTALAAIGGVFAYSCGALDMSMGGSVCVCAISAALIGQMTGSLPLMFLTAVCSAMLLALLKGFLAVFLHVPMFILTIVLGMALSSLGLVLMGGTSVLNIASLVGSSQYTAVYIALLGIFYMVSLVIFNYFTLGKHCRIVGGNRTTARQTGIDINKTTIYAFLMGGVSIALATIVTLLRSKSISAKTADSLGTDMMVAIVLGGMPLSGGPKSKISASIVGAAIITVLNNGLGIIGLDNGTIQFVRGILFLLVVFITSFTYRSELLPR